MFHSFIRDTVNSICLRIGHKMNFKEGGYCFLRFAGSKWGNSATNSEVSVFYLGESDKQNQ